MIEYNKEKFMEMIRSVNVFLSIFGLNVLYDENDEIPVCSLMTILDGKGNAVGALKGYSYDRDSRKYVYTIHASTDAFPKIEAKIVPSKKRVVNEDKVDRGVHYFCDINYEVSTKNVLANNLSGNFEISDPISNIDLRETTVEREINFNLKASQRPNELFSISSKNAKVTFREEYCDNNGYIGSRDIKMHYDGGEIVLTIKKDGNSSLKYIGLNGEIRVYATVLDAKLKPRIEVFIVEKHALDNMTEEEKKEYHAKELKKILDGNSFSNPFDDNKITAHNIDIENDGRGNILQLFNAISSYVPKIDMHEVQNKACTFMDYLGSDNCAPIHVFYSLMSVAFGFLNDDELTKLVGLNPRKLEDTPVVDNKYGTVILPQHKVSVIVKE